MFRNEKQTFKAFSLGKTGLLLTQFLLKSNPCIRKTQRFFHVVLLVSDLDNPGHSALTSLEFPESQEAGETSVPTLRGPPCTNVHSAAAQRSRDLPGVPCPPPRGRDALPAAAGRTCRARLSHGGRGASRGLWPPLSTPPGSSDRKAQQEELTELAVFAFKPFRTGAGVVPDAVFTAALIQARVAFTLVSICKGSTWRPALAANAPRQGSERAVLVLAHVFRQLE